MIAGQDDGDNDWEAFKDGRQVGRIHTIVLPDSERSLMCFI